MKRQTRRYAAMRSIFVAMIMLSAPTAVVHAREVPQYAKTQPGHGEASPYENTLSEMIEEENARLDRLVRSICRGC
jgi:hypothetical protein